MSEKIQKIISAAGLMSRRAAEEALRGGRVTVNGRAALLGDRADAESDTICVDGQPLSAPGRKLYIVLNKPRGYVTTMHDEKGRRSVCELVSELESRVYPVGRLDMQSEGLLIMTNDGDFANALMHPSHEINKTYRTWVSGQSIRAAVKELRQPMELDGYRIRAAGVEIEEITGTEATLLITIHEGRNRQIRKMCEQSGLRVRRLCRIREGAVSLGNLPSGKWRYLTDAEVKQMK
ncbi:MAG: rRNA pseudouridine synthase [Oscillospiraceae bacterium]|nr:rRNA pseudouridine synthase [Oscillospiraceae bacterium]